MSRNIAKSIGFLMVAGMLMTGCGGDDCPECPENPLKSLVEALVVLDSSHLEFTGSLYGVDASVPDVDSIKLAGFNCQLKGLAEGRQYSVEARLDQWVPDIVSGDTVELEIFTPDCRSTGKVVVLDRNLDQPDIIGWSVLYPYDTVAVGSDIVINWHRSENIEWYWISAAYAHGSQAERNDYLQTDTVFTIPGSMTEYDGEYGILFFCGTGPMPESETFNVTGECARGTFGSIFLMYFGIVVGEGWETMEGYPEIDMPDFYKQFSPD